MQVMMDGSSRPSAKRRCALKLLPSLRDFGGSSGIRTHFAELVGPASLPPYIISPPTLLSIPHPACPTSSSVPSSNHLPTHRHTTMSSTTTWNVLPVEMKLSVVDLLDLHDVKSLSLVNWGARSITVPSIFRVRPLVLMPLLDTNR